MMPGKVSEHADLVLVNLSSLIQKTHFPNKTLKWQIEILKFLTKMRSTKGEIISFFATRMLLFFFFLHFFSLIFYSICAPNSEIQVA